nr:immunoglobulin heavy chain junction region [Macaca mulatta]MOW18943.1 immunoglobulin heavy chain junction region [Macaca mulatta]MOW19094.1 immunoglobulin heavy chain junction region [Macaca mulatta]MOW19130.1 immunoglobulin heavy chain junction region [Macaca mulatta]MOW19134.1 immunoglobulin heavy chain junction region [Macaca mulatta]
CARKEDDFDFW